MCIYTYIFMCIYMCMAQEAVRLFQTKVLGSLSSSAASVSEVQWRPHGSASTFAGFEQKQWPIGELWGQSLWWNSGIIYVRV